MTKGKISILNTATDNKTKELREKYLQKVMKKLNKKNINIVSTDVTETHTIINYEVK